MDLETPHRSHYVFPVVRETADGSDDVAMTVLLPLRSGAHTLALTRSKPATAGDFVVRSVNADGTESLYVHIVCCGCSNAVFCVFFVCVLCIFCVFCLLFCPFCVFLGRMKSRTASLAALSMATPLPLSLFQCAAVATCAAFTSTKAAATLFSLRPTVPLDCAQRPATLFRMSAPTRQWRVGARSVRIRRQSRRLRRRRGPQRRVRSCQTSLLVRIYSCYS